MPDSFYPTEAEGVEVTGREFGVLLTADEIAYVLDELHGEGHGHHSGKDDFESECPACTAADKLYAIARAQGAA